MSQMIRDCLLSALSEIIPILLVTQLIGLIARRGIRALTRNVILRLLRSVAGRIVPVLGIVWTAWLVYRAIRDCDG